MKKLYASGWRLHTTGTLVSTVSQPDLAGGRFRFAGNPAARIAKNYLRVPRFFRFQGRYGRTPPDALGRLDADAPANAVPRHCWAQARRQPLIVALVAERDTLLALLTEREVDSLAWN
jgi:hypothetical protein